jgi:hypothetical protein
VTLGTSDPVFLTVEDVLALHDDQIRLFGGSDGIRDGGALDSAVATPESTFDGRYLHEDLFHQAGMPVGLCLGSVGSHRLYFLRRSGMLGKLVASVTPLPRKRQTLDGPDMRTTPCVGNG